MRTERYTEAIYFQLFLEHCSKQNILSENIHSTVATTKTAINPVWGILLHSNIFFCWLVYSNLCWKGLWRFGGTATHLFLHFAGFNSFCHLYLIKFYLSSNNELQIHTQFKWKLQNLNNQNYCCGWKTFIILVKCFFDNNF